MSAKIVEIVQNSEDCLEHVFMNFGKSWYLNAYCMKATQNILSLAHIDYRYNDCALKQ